MVKIVLHKCEKCSKEYQHKQGLSCHRHQCQKSNKFRCLYYQKNFTRNDSLNAHEKVCKDIRGTKQIRCHICAKEFHKL